MGNVFLSPTVRRVIAHVNTQIHTHTHTHTHTGTTLPAICLFGSIGRAASWDLGLSPCHFFAPNVEVSGIGTASHTQTHTHTHAHTYTHTHTHMNANKRAGMLICSCQNVTYIRRVIAHVQTHTHTSRHHSPCRLSSRIVWMNSSVIDAWYCIRCMHLMTGGVSQMPSWDLGLSPCHFLA